MPRRFESCPIRPWQQGNRRIERQTNTGGSGGVHTGRSARNTVSTRPRPSKGERGRETTRRDDDDRDRTANPRC